MAGEGFESAMIPRLRSSTPVRAALGVAALLSLTAAFGLHPEPSGSTARPEAPGIAAKASVAAPAHDCIACLSGGSALVAEPAGLAHCSADSGPAMADRIAAPPARLLCGSLSGRSPPAFASS